jgi:hypothetical protein
MKVPAALLVAAAAGALAPTPPAAIERWYANGVFPALQPAITSFSNLSAIALLDLLILIAVSLVSVAALRAFRRKRTGGAAAGARAAVRLLAAAAALYLVFLAVWGLNYRRVPLVQRLRFDPARLSAERARTLALESTTRLNALYEQAHGGPEPVPYAWDPQLAEAFHAAAGQFGVSFRPVLARPKRSLLDPYFRRAGVAGMIDPFFMETLIASDLLPVERPFVVAHEWGHVAGIADEGEANFAGWLACLRGTPAHQYSGWLFAYSEVTGSLAGPDQQTVAAQLGAGPRADLAAIRDRLQRNVNPRVSSAGWRVYDRYLKANGVAAGAASYSEVVRLMLGVELDAAPPIAATGRQPADRTGMAAVTAAVRGSPR